MYIDSVLMYSDIVNFYNLFFDILFNFISFSHEKMSLSGNSALDDLTLINKKINF